MVAMQGPKPYHGRMPSRDDRLLLAFRTEKRRAAPVFLNGVLYGALCLAAVACASTKTSSDQPTGGGGQGGFGGRGDGGRGGDSSGGTLGGSGGDNSGGNHNSGGLADIGGAGGSVSTENASLFGQICAGKDLSADPLPASPSASAVKAGFEFLEGPVWLAKEQALFFSDMQFSGGNEKGPPSTIHKLTLPNTTEVFVQQSGSNGLALTNAGEILACTHDTQSLSVFDPQTAQRTALPGADMFEGKTFNSPNDVAVSSTGHIYFTDPDWQRGQRPGQGAVHGVYHRKPDGKIELIDGSRQKPNGITLAPDEKTLYVGAVDGLINAHPVAADGSVGAGQRFAQVGGPDGFVVDCAGNLYVAAGGGVHVFDAEGQNLGLITGTGGGASNVAFGGPDHKTLFITNRETLYSIKLGLPGLPY